MNYVQLSKLESETLPFEMDFGNRMLDMETVQTAASTISVHTGLDPNPLSMLDGLPVVSNTYATQILKGGLPGVVYRLTLSIRSSDNNIYINESLIAVLSDNAILPPEL